MAAPLRRWLRRHLHDPLDHLYARLDEHVAELPLLDAHTPPGPARRIPTALRRGHHDRAA